MGGWGAEPDVLFLPNHPTPSPPVGATAASWVFDLRHYVVFAGEDSNPYGGLVAHHPRLRLGCGPRITTALGLTLRTDF